MPIDEQLLSMPTSDIAGLCETCLHCKRIVSDKGSVFYRCLLSDSDKRFAKYPRIPVLVCSGYQGRMKSPVAGSSAAAEKFIENSLPSPPDGKGCTISSGHHAGPNRSADLGDAVPLNDSSAVQPHEP